MGINHNLHRIKRTCLIALNAARWQTHIGINKFSLFIGLIALALSAPGITGVEMPFNQH